MCSSSTCDDNPKDGKGNGTGTSVDVAKGEGSSHCVRSEVLLKLSIEGVSPCVRSDRDDIALKMIGRLA